MQCNKCKTEMRIVKSTNVLTKEGKFVRRQILACMNKNCPDYKDEAESIDIELSYEREGEE